MEISIIIGSIRKNSYNAMLGNYIVQRFSDSFSFNLINIKDLPYFSEDIEKNIPQEVKKEGDKIKKSKGVIIITPEYNNSIPGVLKNALDWFSRGEQVLLNKPYMTMGASPGRYGTISAQKHLNEILTTSAYNMKAIPNNSLLIGDFLKNLKDDNSLDDTTKKRIDKKFNEFVKWIELVGV